MRKALIRLLCKFLVVCCLALLFCLPASSALALAPATTSVANAPTLQVELGFGATYRTGYWTPVFVTLSNYHGRAFSGMLSVSTYAGNARTSNAISAQWHYQAPVTLRSNTQQQVTLYVPFYFSVGPRGISATANLLDASGKLVATQTSPNSYEVKPGNLFIGTLSDASATANFNPLGNASLLNQTNSPTLSALDATTMPTIAAVLQSFDIIVLDDFTTSSLSAGQLAALQTWVNQGGLLIEVGGAQGQRTLNALPRGLSPVTVDGTAVLAPGTHLLPVGSPTIENYAQKPLPDTLPQSIDVSTATLRSQGGRNELSPYTSEVLLAAGATPLMVQAQQGQGVIFYLAFDPAQSPLADWAGAPTLWQAILLHALGDRFLISSTAPNFYSGPGQLLTRGGVLSIVAPPTLAGPWIMVALLLGYILLLGPVRMLLVRRLQRPQRIRRGWLIIMSGIVVFSLLAYGLAFYEKGASLTDNSISLIQLNQDGSSAYATTYSGIFVPSQGDFTLHIPGESVAQPLPNQLLSYSQAPILDDNVSAAVLSAPGGTDLTLANIGPWTFHPVVTEQDLQLQGGLAAHLALRNNRLVGTITNTLRTSLSDVYVLLPSGFVSIGQLPAGETQQVNLPLNGSSLHAGQTLADAIAESGGLPASYFPYAHNQQPQSDFQRHMALLAALSGAGFGFQYCNGPCNTHAIASRGTLFITGGKVPDAGAIDTPEPLLLPGAPATLIGWADQPVDGIDTVTINGTQPGGQHEKLVQMPLTIDVTASATTPSNFISGRVVNIESYDAQLVLPGIYTMAHGSLTFEFTMPRAQVSGFTITEPDLLGSSAASSAGTSHLLARLYNWQTGKWDVIPLDRDTSTTLNTAAYAGLDGRVLMQVSGQRDFQGNLYFGAPSLSLVP